MSNPSDVIAAVSLLRASLTSSSSPQGAGHGALPDLTYTEKERSAFCGDR